MSVVLLLTMVSTVLEVFILGHYECMAHQVLDEHNSLLRG